jgi:hypothetical protein
MGYAVYNIADGRWGGYGVPAICEYPGCNKKIDRGISYACGGRDFSEFGCGRYFCEEHLVWHSFNVGGHRETVRICERCAKYKPPFPYKPERKEWLRHLLTDASWKEWRKHNKSEVDKIKKSLNN